jgi:hypothetical protein
LVNFVTITPFAARVFALIQDQLLAGLPAAPATQTRLRLGGDRDGGLALGHRDASRAATAKPWSA